MLHTAKGRIHSLPLIALLLSVAASSAFGATAFTGTEADRNAYWLESAVCSIVIKTPIDAVKPLLGGDPIETLAGVNANCTGNMMAQVEVQGGVRTMLQRGFRITSVSHQVTPLRTDANGNVMLLISAIFGLERPQIKNAPVAK